MNSRGRQVENLRYSRLKICPTGLGVLAAVFLSWAGLAKGEGALQAPRKSESAEKPISVFSIKERPQNYTGQRLAVFLLQKLTPEEMSLVKNPLARTPEMIAWARQITAGATNKMDKAMRLFDELVRRVNPPGGGTRTAKEVFAAWKSPRVSFCCEEYTSLYVSLARAAGLQAYSVYVVEQYSGATPRHACAAVFIGDDDFVLVDATIPWFGVPHRSCLMMDDVQTIASYMVQAPGLEQHRIAYKLAPDLSVVESNVYLSLMSENQWNEAKNVLDAMPRWNTEAWVTNMAQGRWALYEGKPADAVTWLERSIQLNPYVGVSRRMLGDALFQQGKLHEARGVYREGLAYLFDEFNIVSVQQAIAGIDELLADRAAASPRADSQESSTTQNDEAALKIEAEQDRSLANVGDIFSMMLLARRYERGNGVDKDMSQALKWYQSAAKAGNAQAMEYLGNIFFRGQGVEKDPAQAVAWWRKAAEAGNSEAMASLGKIYLGGYGVAEDQAQAFAWFQRGADGGNSVAMSSLGWMFAHGVGVGKDYGKGLSWLRKAAEEGANSFAMHELGLMYLNGVGVDQNDREAKDWFQKGADAGDPASMNDLGTMYSSGRGVTQDDLKAFTWFRKAAEAGNPLAMFNLGSIYETGEGTKKDKTEAIRWYRMAQQAGVEEAAKKVESLTK
jgi:TPR repeat protein